MWKLRAEDSTASSLHSFHGLMNAELWVNIEEKMNMILIAFKFLYFESTLKSHFFANLLQSFFYLADQHFFPIFHAPNHME